MSQQVQKNRILYADLLRIVCIIGVPLCHICTNRWTIAFYESASEWLVLNAVVNTFRVVVPLFFMLSAITLLDPDYKFSIKKLYTKSIARLLVALIFWSIAYRLLSPITCIVLDIREVTSNDFHRLYTEFIWGMPWHHLWYVYSLIGVYMMIPLLRIFTANAKKEHYYYFLALFVIFGGTIPLINNIIGETISFGIYELNSYIGFFVLGYFISKFDFSQKEKIIFYTLGIISLVAIVFLSTTLSYAAGAPVHTFLDKKNIFMIFGAIAIFLYFKERIGSSEKMKKYQNNKYITQLAGYGFGIYLVHDFFNVILSLLNINTGTVPFMIAIPLCTAFVYLGSLLVTFIISKIPVLNKWII